MVSLNQMEKWRIFLFFFFLFCKRQRKIINHRINQNRSRPRNQSMFFFSFAICMATANRVAKLHIPFSGGDGKIHRQKGRMLMMKSNRKYFAINKELLFFCSSFLLNLHKRYTPEKSSDKESLELNSTKKNDLILIFSSKVYVNSP